MNISQEILSNLTIYMKYAKYIPELKRRETWDEIVTRNMNMHIKKFPDIKDEIENAYRLVYEKKVLPSMRSMQFAGKAIEITPNRMFNCSYLPMDDYRAFSEIMFLLLSGCGVGISVQKHHVEKLPHIRKPLKSKRFLVGDNIEGWADAVRALTKAYLRNGVYPEFDFSDIRPKGARLITSGGKAPGAEPLKDCLHHINIILDRKNDGEQLLPIDVYDIVCYIADCVLAGGIRRAALITFFSLDDEEMMASKYGNWWEANPQRGRSNNSAVIARHRIRKRDFVELWDNMRHSKSGEPGIFFTNDIEWLANPCAEASLRPYTFCNLTEINASNIESQEDFNERAKACAFIGTLQASYTNFHYLRDIWKKSTEKESLLGVGMTGICSGSVFKYDMNEAARNVCEENKRVAKLIKINPAARTTVVKPSGTSSMVLGCSSGIHAWHSKFYIRRIRVGKNEEIYKYLREHHPELLEDDQMMSSSQAIISIPQKAPEEAITRNETAIEFLNRVKSVYESWIIGGHVKGNNTHNVSATVSIKEDEWGTVGEWMWKNKEFYNCISILPYDGGTYVQAPFEEITEEKYEEMMSHLTAVDITNIMEEEDYTDLKQQASCQGNACELA